jgi:predicted dehydrogenase
MGQVHARAYARLRQHYPEAPLRPTLVAVADNAPDDRLANATDIFGFREAHADWHDLVAGDDIEVVSVTGPNFIHRDVAIAAAEAGKHVWVEKPVGRNAAETRAISDALRANNVQSAVGFNYRNAPAIEIAKQLIAEGRLGRINHVSIRLLADYAAHPDSALTWRFKTEWSGSGVLGDLASHGVDLGRYLVGDITDLMCDAATFIAQRPQVGMTASHFSRGREARWELLRTRITSLHYCVFAAALEEYWSPAEPLLASSAAMASKCTALEVRCLGTSGGWASCSCALTRTMRTPISALTTWHLVMVIWLGSSQRPASL